ncbi:hypothetical protein TIFTF001_030886 [Ficus carica]|uniref:Uncharacterized protein n=1 Tax=Ficus carica TaxID=3494 RepID=A0AA88DU61_FICCA|nr:hypothetical protein TIFTF001_030886 [Ficus carica]
MANLELLMKNLFVGSSSSEASSSGPSAARSRLVRLGLPFKSNSPPPPPPPPPPQPQPPPLPPTTSLSVEKLIASLTDDSKREVALLLLCKVRTSHENMGQMLWDGKGTVFALLKEIRQAHYFLSTPNLTDKVSNRVCNALALLQSVASYPNTRERFLSANILEYLYPFINTISLERPHEFLRLTTLGVIGALLKEDNEDVINILLEGDIVSKILRCLEVGNLLAKTVAAFILERLLTIGEMGQVYCCASAQRFYLITRVLEKRVEELVSQPSQRLLKHIICCYVKLSENPRACDGLLWSLPLKLRDATFLEQLQDDPPALMKLQTLVHNITTGHRSKVQLPPPQQFRSCIRFKGKAVMGSPALPRNHPNF